MSLGAKLISKGNHPTPVSLVWDSLAHLQADAAWGHLREVSFFPRVQVDAEVLMHRGELPMVASHIENVILGCLRVNSAIQTTW